MTELRDPKTSSPVPSPSAGAGTAVGDSDALHGLYRMSRTAGLGSGDYVAINNTAIVSLILGFVSVLSLLYPIVLVAALAAVVCGILALVQVRSSNGTQSGRAIAGAGILLGLALGGVAGARVASAGMEKRRDEQAIDALVKQLDKHIVAKDYAGAYQNLFTDAFKEGFTPQAFAERWESFAPLYGGVKSIDWGKRAEIEHVRATGEKRGVASSSVQFEKFQEPARQPITLVDHDGQWKIDGIGQLFEKPRDAKNQPAMPDPTRPMGPEFTLPGTQGPPDGAPAPQ